MFKKTDTAKGTAKVAVKSNANTSDESPQDDNVDKIRDILFGNQMRDFDHKFNQLEERLNSDLAAIRKENTLQIESLQSFIEGEIDILSNKLAGEEKNRIEEQDDLQGELKKSGKHLDTKISDLGKSLDNKSRDINQKILKQSQDFNAELNAQMEQTRKRMDTHKKELSSSKVDKSILAEMLNSVALKINAEEPNQGK